MDWLKTILKEIFGLFVDDGSFAVAIIAWLGLSRLALRHLHLPGYGPAFLLVAGLLAILLESVVRRARHRAG